MSPEWIILLGIASGGVIAIAAFTAAGQRRRGARLPTVILAGLFFPLAWVGWYRHDAVQTEQNLS